MKVEEKQAEIKRLEEEVMSQPSFWDKQELAQKTIAEVNLLKNAITGLIVFKKKVDDLEVMLELINETEGDEQEAFEKEATDNATSMREELENLEIQCFLSGPLDKSNAILTIHAGAGGTESCDWADMLFRMYCRWGERAGFEVEVLDVQPGEEAGITRATIRYIGANAYGYIKSERGVHRLVRISPFDSNARRHTSFCAIDVIAEIEDDVNVDIKEEDLRIDTYRASGKGGQHVNKTESAIRITHIPTNIVVTCQSERSQIKNRATAMKILKSRIYEKMQDEKRSEMEKFYGEKGEIGWGNQIRSYVFQPYQMVKDLRTGAETGNIQAVMDGDIQKFINAWLRAGCPIGRNKDIKIED